MLIQYNRFVLNSSQWISARFLKVKRPNVSQLVLHRFQPFGIVWVCINKHFWMHSMCFVLYDKQASLRSSVSNPHWTAGLSKPAVHLQFHLLQFTAPPLRRKWIWNMFLDIPWTNPCGRTFFQPTQFPCIWKKMSHSGRSCSTCTPQKIALLLHPNSGLYLPLYVLKHPVWRFILWIVCCIMLYLLVLV